MIKYAMWVKDKLNLKTKLIEIINTLCYKETKKVMRQTPFFFLTPYFAVN